MKAFPLQDVIDDLLNTDKSLSSPLMKLHYFGKLIGNQELIDYTHREINGYTDSEKVDIPPYRKTPSTLRIEMQAYMHRHHATLPISMIEKEIRDELEFVYIREGIASIEKMAGQSIENDGELVRQLPLECLFAFQEPARKLYKSDVRLNVISAKLVGNSNVLVEIPNSIRGKLLDFVFLMAETFGYNIEIESFKSQINNNQTIINHMNTIINNTGDGNILNTGDKAKIDAHIHITKNNKDELIKHLREIGITEDDTAELIQIIDEDQPDYERKTFGRGVNAWISKMFSKAIDGSWNIGIGAAGGVLAEAIGKYFGF